MAFAYQDGMVVDAHILGYTKTLEQCTTGVAKSVTKVSADYSDYQFSAVCIAIPASPAATVSKQPRVKDPTEQSL